MPLKLSISVNNQSDYIETDKVIANNGDIVYVKIERQSTDSGNFKLDGMALATFPSYIEQLAFDTIKRISASATSISDTKRTVLHLISNYFDSEKKIINTIQRKYDSLRKIAASINSIHDTRRKLNVVIYVYVS